MTAPVRASVQRTTCADAMAPSKLAAAAKHSKRVGRIKRTEIYIGAGLALCVSTPVALAALVAL